MITLEEFEAQPWASRLLTRKKNFWTMIDHVQRSGCASPVIIETGTAWDMDNFEGQGQSTLVWDWAAERISGQVISIDIRQEGIDVAKQQTKNVAYLCGNSIQILPKIANISSAALLYLDSYDWTPELNLESAMHHMMELAGVYAKLPAGCMIVVDDRHGNMKGKHWVVEAFFDQLDVKPVFKNHQIGWIKGA